MPPKKPSVEVTRESDSGRNLNFKDTRTGESMTRAQFVKKIENGVYKDYYVRKQEGLKTPAAKPDKSEGNNLG